MADTDYRMTVLGAYDVDQRGRLIHKPINVHAKPGREVTQADRDLLAKYGSIEALEAAGLYGTADVFRQEAAK